jgi:5-dehydro-2-deoxygluconokinase
VLNRERVYMLAADHRWQWEEWCDAERIARPRIAETKELARRGFALARERSDRVRRYGALLLDHQYGGAAVARAVADGIEVGTPAEKAGAFPMEWGSAPFSAGLTGSFVKVLVRYRDDHAEGVRREHVDKLLTLQAWCRVARKTLVVEIVVPRTGEAEDEFERSGRPAMLAAFIREGYARGLEPEFWKIEGSASADGARIVDDAIRERPGCRQLILGKAASLETIGAWFATARTGSSAAGFAIGRSVYWQPCADYLTGRSSDTEAASRICGTYIDLIAAWEG